MAQGSEGSKAIALGLCREFEDEFLEHIAGGEVSEYNVHPLGLHLLDLFIILSFIFVKRKGIRNFEHQFTFAVFLSS